MLTKPFNGEKLWVGTMQKNTYSQTTPKPPMILPEINWLTGHYKPPSPSISEQMNYNYSMYSAAYWNGVKMRQQKYREQLLGVETTYRNQYKDHVNQTRP